MVACGISYSEVIRRDSICKNWKSSFADPGRYVLKAPLCEMHRGFLKDHWAQFEQAKSTNTRPACESTSYERYKKKRLWRPPQHLEHTADRRRHCHHEFKGGDHLRGPAGAMAKLRIAVTRQRNSPIYRQPRIVRAARTSQIPRATPTSDITISRHKIRHRRLPIIGL